MGKDEALTCNSAQEKGQSVQQSPIIITRVYNNPPLLYTLDNNYRNQVNTPMSNTSPIVYTVVVIIPCVLYCLQGWLLHEVCHKWC